MADGRPAALGVPPSTPGHGEVVGVAVPEGVARGQERPADAIVQSPAVRQQSLRPACTGAEPVLEDDGNVHPGALGDGDQLVGLGKAQRRRLLQEHRHTSLEALDRQRDVRAGWSADVREVHPAAVGPGLAKCGAQVVAPALDPVPGGETLGPRRVDVHPRDDHCARAVAGDRGGVRARDRARADDQCAPEVDNPTPSSRRAASTACLIAIDKHAATAPRVSYIIVMTTCQGG